MLKAVVNLRKVKTVCEAGAIYRRPVLEGPTANQLFRQIMSKCRILFPANKLEAAMGFPIAEIPRPMAAVMHLGVKVVRVVQLQAEAAMMSCLAAGASEAAPSARAVPSAGEAASARAAQSAKANRKKVVKNIANAAAVKK